MSASSVTARTAAARVRGAAARFGFGWLAALIALGCFLLSAAQRRLSTPARELRRRTQSVSGTRMRSDGSSEALSRERLLAPLDGALAALSLAIFVTACAALASRL